MVKIFIGIQLYGDTFIYIIQAYPLIIVLMGALQKLCIYTIWYNLFNDWSGAGTFLIWVWGWKGQQNAQQKLSHWLWDRERGSLPLPMLPGYGIN